ncbi:murein DD-endopeptidase MepM [bacterium BMS3Abin09]|nr:murein DD-endopeptidase MepM [bacterium BMS3Abin09]GBE41527.1 murein DD-endopeptidase MepM [bacterium BMS3Bbin09]
MFYCKKNSEKGFSRIALTLSLPFIIIAIAYVVYKLFFIPDPVVSGIEAFELLPADKTVIFKGENVNSLDISIFQDGKLVNLLQDKPEVSEKTYNLQVKPKELMLHDGSAVIIINAKAGVLKEVKYEFKTLIDTDPPAIEIIKAPHYIYQGSGGFALLRARGADAVYIKQGNKKFRAFEYLPETDLYSDSFQEFGAAPETAQKGYKKNAVKIYTVFFPAAYDITDKNIFYAVAADKAGNQKIKALRIKTRTKKYTTSSIQIDDSFIRTVVSPLLNETSISDVEGAFRKINEGWREKDNKKILEITQDTSHEILWEGRFLQMRNSKVMATYGDRRTYIYNDKEISKSIHLGYDLASFANAPVEAANSGIVKFAGDLGIYGNAIIIDHGQGLMSLYGHLSMLMVDKGQTVAKGDIIAKTGSSGFAGGDHLHFGILIHGYAVSPLYWWDRNWVKINIFDRLDTYTTRH